MMQDIYTLNLLIEINRERMEDLAYQLGRTHSRTIRQSQKLDKLIVQWQRLMLKNQVAA